MPELYWTGKPLMAMGLPWLTPGAIRALDEFVTPEMDVLEFGSGGSTIFFSKRCRSVLSWEPSLKWRRTVKSLCGVNASIGGCLECFLKCSSQFDVVLVDNDDKAMNRARIVSRVLTIVRPGGWFILDNYGRYRTSFPDDWNQFRHDDAHWSGKGTLICKIAKNSNQV